MSKLNESQVRHVTSTFSYIDALLGSVEKLARADLSPFAAERADVAPDEGRLILSSVAVARRRMLAALDRLGIPRPQSTVSARWGIETTYKFAASALGELDAVRLRGYGAADEDVARELEALASDLEALILRSVGLLHERDVGGLKERLAMLHGPVGEVLRTLERLSTEQGLAELRSLIAAAAERATSATFDVGVFGRVSAGKSSLINALAGTPVLPMGATPTTAVPLRVAKGQLGALVHLLDGGRQELAVEQIAVYATEDQNPENQRGVREIEVRAPTVPDGLRFLDTPGVGSLATSGPAQAFAWLPRCDLGVVLVAAGGPVGPDDIALVAGLVHVGIACRVLLSKSDLLSPDERSRATAHIAKELGAALGGAHSVEVQAISSLTGYSEQLDALRRQVLEPLAADHARAARDALRARLHSLVGAAGAALAGRPQASDERVIERRTASLAARERIKRETACVAGGGTRVLEQAVDAIAAAWSRGEDGAAAVKRALLMAQNRALASVSEVLEQTPAGEPSDPMRRRVPPLFDPELLSALPDLAPPRLGFRFARRFLARRRLEPVGSDLQEALQRFASRLRAWGLAGLDDPGAVSWIARPVEEVPQHALLAGLDALVNRI